MSNNIVVIGAAGLIGGALVEGLSGRAYNVIRADNGLENDGANDYFVDITNIQSLVELSSKVTRDHGQIFSVINCAYPKSPDYGKELDNVSFEGFCADLSVHLGGYFLVMKHFCEELQPHSSLVNLASIYGLIAPKFELYEGMPFTMPVQYSAIKAGILALSKYFAKAYLKKPIRVNCISPGGVLDAQPAEFIRKYGEHTVNDGLLDAGELVGAARYLIAESSKSITGTNLVLDGGFCL